MIVKRLNRAAVSRVAGVSRAAVTRWFHHVSKDGWVNVESQTLLQLATALKVPPEMLLKKTPRLDLFQTRFLWDRLYPTMEEFIQALVQSRPMAMARLVQLIGFRDAVTVVGKKAIKLFHQYKKYIMPRRREQLEVLWPLYASQI